MSESLSALQRWYLEQCDSEWEHSNGIKIESLDNPGWSFEVDLQGTRLEGRPLEPVRIVRAGNDWLDYKVCDGRYQSYGGPLNLEEMIREFLRWVAE